MTFDTTYPWSHQSNETKKQFKKKCRQIEKYALDRICFEFKLNYKDVKDKITHLNAEDEWDESVGYGVPDDGDWVDYEIQFMTEELEELEII